MAFEYVYFSGYRIKTVGIIVSHVLHHIQKMFAEGMLLAMCVLG